MNDLSRRLLAEFLGTGLLVAAVVGSGIMAVNLSDDVGLQLSINDASTVAMLAILIALLLPVSGAHFNPAVSLVAAVRRELAWPEAGLYGVAQMTGGIAGTVLAHAMFDLDLLDTSTKERSGLGQFLGEVVATAGLLLVIGVLARRDKTDWIVWAVPAWIGSAYLFTSSTSFANPAVTIARSLTDSFSGIAPSDVILFVLAQLLGAAIGAVLASTFVPEPQEIS